MAGRSLGKIIGSADVLAHIALQAARIGQLQAAFEAALPAAMRPYARVANFKSGRVVILAENGASALKIKQLASSITASLAAKRPEVTEIEVRVQVGSTAMFRESGTASHTSQDRALSGQAALQLQKLAESLPQKSPLKASLERLIGQSRSED